MLIQCCLLNSVLLAVIRLLPLSFAHSASGSIVHYITPSQSVQSQKGESTKLLTLSMLVANTSDLIAANTTLIFLEGNHILETDLVLTNLDNLLIQSTNASVTVNIICSSGVNLEFINITKLSISSLEFTRCCSVIKLVNHFFLRDSRFHGGNNYSAALQLIQTNSDIVRSSFTSSTLGNLSTLSLPVYTFSTEVGETRDLSYYTYTARVGGALVIKKSCVEISGSCFEGNNAEVGGAIYSQTGSNITINNCTFVNNKASCSDRRCFGGALFIGIGCTAIANNCTFLNNTSEYSGGAIALYQGNFLSYQNVFSSNQAQVIGGGIVGTCNSTLTLVQGSFSNNWAGENGGALFINSGLVTINSSSFDWNEANLTGGAMYSSSSIVTVHNCSFDSNDAWRGGVVFVHCSSVTLYNNSFDNNLAGQDGGAIYANHQSNITVHNSSFDNNKANFGGALYASTSSILTVHNSSFDKNKACLNGGVVHASHQSSIMVQNSYLDKNEARYGGVVYASSSSITVHDSSFNNNKASFNGGVVRASHQSSIIVHNGYFKTNEASQDGGVMSTSSSNITVHNSLLENNNASYGGVVLAFTSNITLHNSVFNSNDARFGGVVYVFTSSITVQNSTFDNNRASQDGGVMRASFSSMIMKASEFISNTATRGGVLVLLLSKSMFTGDKCLFFGNLAHQGGVVHANESTVYFLSQSLLIANNTATENGGALLLLNTSLYISSVNSLIHGNLAHDGGAIYAYESTLIVEMYSRTTVDTNLANENGGGLQLIRSKLNIKGNGTKIIRNRAEKTGGGLHAVNSSILFKGRVQFINNQADNGAGIGLENNTIIVGISPKNISIIDFISNRASEHGGALYVNDETYPDTCDVVGEQNATSANECFSKLVFFNFSGNLAGVSGANLFGGLLDRCNVHNESGFFEESKRPHGLVSFLRASNIKEAQLDTISSHPVRLCFCRDGHPDCYYEPDTTKVNHGSTFSLQVITYDQVNRSVISSIKYWLNLLASTNLLNEDQDIQKTNKGCSRLDFTIISSQNSAELTVSIEGPCSVPGISDRNIMIETTCTCAIGFQTSQTSERLCNCICASVLQSYVATQCDPTTQTIIRKNSFWITYVNYSQPSGYVIHPYCPYDYCHPPEEDVVINLNVPNGADAQCSSNRSGTLCGSCQSGFSVSLGSSSCLHCPPYWPALLVTIITAFILSGIGLVALLLILNLTVAVGTLNAIIFYANIVAANKSALFSTSKVSFASVFISWLNFDIGFDMCFFNGMDTYTKTWLQLAFPAYIFLLVAVIIILSYRFKFFGNLIEKKDPVATLATLILLSYAKLLQTALTAFSSVTLVYPDNSNVSVWLPDATVGYLTAKHAVLFGAAILILLAGLIYTFLLFLWQWFLYCLKKRVKSITNQKLSSFFETYQIPYAPKHRYWTGLLLLVRVIIYLVSAFNPSGDPRITLLSTAVIMTCLYLYMTMFSVRLYKTWPINVTESIAYFNITAVSIITWYLLDSDKRYQSIITNISVTITFIQLWIVICYHIFRYANQKLYTKISNIPVYKKTIKKTAPQKKKRVHFKDAPLPADNDIHQFHELLDIIDRPVNTDDYKIPQVHIEEKPVEPTKSVVEPPKPLLEQPPRPLEVIMEEEEEEQQLSEEDGIAKGHSATINETMQHSNDVSKTEISEFDVCPSNIVLKVPMPYPAPLTTQEESEEKNEHKQKSSEIHGRMAVENSRTTSINESKQRFNSYLGMNMSLCYGDIRPSSFETEIECDVNKITAKSHDDNKIEVVVEVHMDSQLTEENVDASVMDTTNHDIV